MRAWLLPLCLLLLTGVPRGTPAAAGDAARLVRESVERTLAHQTLHFTITNVAGETSLAPGVTVAEIAGDLQRPDRFRAVVTVEALFADLEIEIIGIGTRFWWTNPLLGRDDFVESPVDPEIMAVANPETIVRLIPALIVAPTLAGDETLAGTPTTRVAGTLDLSRLAEVAPDLPTGAVMTGARLPLIIWIDGEGRIVQLEMTGRFVEQDDDEVVRRITLSAFDAPIEITPPA